MEEIQKGYVFVNLLPYREKNKKEKIQNITAYLVMYALIAISFIVLAYTYYSLEIDNQKDRNLYIEKENKKLDNKIKEIADLKDNIKQTLEKRKVVEILQVNRSDAVNLFNNIANELPEGTSLKTVNQKEEDGKDKITITGITQSNNKVSEYMTKLEKAGYMNPYLVETKAVQTTKKQGNKIVDDMLYNEFTIFVYLPKYEIEDTSMNKKGSKK